MRSDLHVDVVRNRLSDERSQQILAFWKAHGALEGQPALDRLPEVVCVLVDGDEVVGVNSVQAAAVPLIGGRTFWLYRRFLAPGLTEQGHDIPMLNEAFAALESEFDDGEGQGPLGLCLMIDEPEIMRARPEAIWPETNMLYAGYGARGQQVRIRYFENAKIA